MRDLEDTIHYLEIRRKIPSYHRYMVTKLFATHEAYTMLPNTYPYLPFHRLMFINPKYDRFYTMTRIKSTILTLYPNAQCIFENPMDRQSIPTIRHIHFSLPPSIR